MFTVTAAIILTACNPFPCNYSQIDRATIQTRLWGSTPILKI